MENWFDLLIILLFLIFGALGSASSAKKKKERKHDRLEETEAKPQQPPPRQTQPPPRPKSWPKTPEAEIPQQKSIEETVWGEQSTSRREAYESQESREERKRRMEERARRRHQLDPVSETSMEEAASRGMTIEDVFRDMFQLEDESKSEQSGWTPATPEPLPKPKAIKKKKQPKKEIKKTKPRPEPKPEVVKSGMMPGHTSKYGGEAPSIIQHLANEAQSNPLRAAVIFSEIMKRRKPIHPFPNLKQSQPKSQD